MFKRMVLVAFVSITGIDKLSPVLYTGFQLQ